MSDIDMINLDNCPEIGLLIDNINDSDIIDIIDKINQEKYKIKKSKKGIKVSKERQLKINEASRKCRLKKKLNFNIMIEHINSLHNLINTLNIDNIEIKKEINKYKLTIIK